MSSNQQQDPLAIAQQAERDLNSQQAKGTTASGTTLSDTLNDSGINSAATSKFPGSSVTIGSEASGRTIPPSEGGDVKKETGQYTKAEDFEGVGGPEDKARLAQETRGGDDDVRGNVRQGGETRRP